MSTAALDELHPKCTRARLVRSLRALRRVRGWGRFVNWLVPSRVAGPFVIVNDGLAFAGDLGSYIDRHTYLLGQYEERSLDLFLSLVPKDRRRLILDVGANVGTHSLVFGRHFRRVHAFEPNPDLWAQFERNIAINGFDHVTLHRAGVGDQEAELPFYLIDAPNYGLGTFSAVEQYSMPLKRAGVCRLVNGDEYLRQHGLHPVDAIKIDVQGFEPQVLRGLNGALRQDRPIVWFEQGLVTQETIRALPDLKELFPYSIVVYRVAESGRLTLSSRLERVSDELRQGDYLVVPAEFTYT